MKMESIHTSDECKELMQALLFVQEKVGVIEKSAANPHFKSKYAPLDAIWQRATKVCAEEGIVVTQPATGRGVWTIIYHVPSGQWMASYFELPLVAPPVKVKDAQGKVVGTEPGQVTPQIVGSVTSYARRYAYLSALGLVAGEEDDDGNASSVPAQEAPKAGLRERKEAAYKRLRGIITHETAIPCDDARLMKWLEDIVGRPFEDLVLKDEAELKLVEQYVNDASK